MHDKRQQASQPASQPANQLISTLKCHRGSGDLSVLFDLRNYCVVHPTFITNGMFLHDQPKAGQRRRLQLTWMTLEMKIKWQIQDKEEEKPKSGWQAGFTITTTTAKGERGAIPTKTKKEPEGACMMLLLHQKLTHILTINFPVGIWFPLENLVPPFVDRRISQKPFSPLPKIPRIPCLSWHRRSRGKMRLRVPWFFCSFFEWRSVGSREHERKVLAPPCSHRKYDVLSKVQFYTLVLGGGFLGSDPKINECSFPLSSQYIRV